MTFQDFTGSDQPCNGCPLMFMDDMDGQTKVYFRSSRVSSLMGGILVVVADMHGYTFACLPSELSRIPSED